MADKKLTPIVVYRGQKNIENLPKPTKPNHCNPINILIKQRAIKKVQIPAIDI